MRLKEFYRKLAQSFTKRRCTTKTPPEIIDLEPADPTQGPSQASQDGNEDFPEVKTLIAQSDREAADRFLRKSVSTQRKRKQLLLVHYVDANSFSQKLWSFIRDRTEYDLHALVETHLPSSSHDQYSDQLCAVGWKLTEFTAARPSPRLATGTTGGAAILARSHLRIDSSLDVLSCAQTVEEREPIDFAAAIVHGCHSRILLVACYLTDSQGASALNLTKLARFGPLVSLHEPPTCDCGRCQHDDR